MDEQGNTVLPEGGPGTGPIRPRDAATSLAESTPTWNAIPARSSIQKGARMESIHAAWVNSLRHRRPDLRWGLKLIRQASAGISRIFRRFPTRPLLVKADLTSKNSIAYGSFCESDRPYRPM